MEELRDATANIFLSTPSARRATVQGRYYGKADSISIHALREEGDQGLLQVCHPPADFYPRPPRGGRLSGIGNLFSSAGFLSTPSARRATNRSTFTPISTIHFYPRPPRGGRPRSSVVFAHKLLISIHALREEGDLHRRCQVRRRQGFLSTPSARRATDFAISGIYFTPISIHALREEGDVVCEAPPLAMLEFLSTPSARRATHRYADQRRAYPISIHALREEGDPVHASTPTWQTNFYPRPPRGGRP